MTSAIFFALAVFSNEIAKSVTDLFTPTPALAPLPTLDETDGPIGAPQVYQPLNLNELVLAEQLRTIFLTLAIVALAILLLAVIARVLGAMKARARSATSWTTEYSTRRHAYRSALTAAGVPAEAFDRSIADYLQRHTNWRTRARNLAKSPEARENVEMYLVHGTEWPARLPIGLWDTPWREYERDSFVLFHLEQALLECAENALALHAEPGEWATIQGAWPRSSADAAAHQLRAYLEGRDLDGMVIVDPDHYAAAQESVDAVTAQAIEYRVVVRTEPGGDDDMVRSLALVAAAAPLAFISYAAGQHVLTWSRRALLHTAEVLSLHGYAPAEIQADPAFNGIADPDVLASWAIRQIVEGRQDDLVPPARSANRVGRVLL